LAEVRPGVRRTSDSLGQPCANRQDIAVERHEMGEVALGQPLHDQPVERREVTVSQRPAAGADRDVKSDGQRRIDAAVEDDDRGPWVQRAKGADLLGESLGVGVREDGEAQGHASDQV